MNNHIDWKAVESHWEEYKDRIKDKWKKLTDDDLKNIHGDRHRLMQALQDRYQLTKDKVEKQVEEFLDTAGTWMEGAKQRVMEVAERGKQYMQENTIKDMTADIRYVIRKNPVRSTLVSIGIGFLLGKLLSSSSRA